MAVGQSQFIPHEPHSFNLYNSPNLHSFPEEEQIHGEDFLLPQNVRTSSFCLVPVNYDDGRSSISCRSSETFDRCYQMGPVLGKGGFGIVYAGVRICDGRHVALKHIFKTKIPEYGKVCLITPKRNCQLIRKARLKIVFVYFV